LGKAGRTAGTPPTFRAISRGSGRYFQRSAWPDISWNVPFGDCGCLHLTVQASNAVPAQFAGFLDRLHVSRVLTVVVVCHGPALPLTDLSQRGGGFLPPPSFAARTRFIIGLAGPVLMAVMKQMFIRYVGLVMSGGRMRLLGILAGAMGAPSSLFGGRSVLHCMVRRPELLVLFVSSGVAMFSATREASWCMTSGGRCDVVGRGARWSIGRRFCV